MLTKEREEQLNYSLAVGFVINSIIVHGRKKAMKDIDETFPNPVDRLYIRSLFDTAEYVIEQDEHEAFKPR